MRPVFHIHTGGALYGTLMLLKAHNSRNPVVDYPIIRTL
jgi:hypothetical protein